MTQLKEKLSFFIPSQLPEYVRDNYSTFVEFLEAYYRFMEQDDEAQAIIQNAKNTRDIDLTVDKFVEKLFAEVASDMPKLIFNNVDPFTDVPLFQNVNEINSKRALAKRITSFYQTKGGENSIKLFFKIFYDDEIQIDYPQKYMLRASDGVYQKKKTLKVYDPTGTVDIEKIAGKNVLGQASNAFAIIDRVTGAGFEYPDINVFELWIEENSQRDTFIRNETLYCPGANVYVKLLPVISSFIVDKPGFGYYGGETVTITNASGQSFRGKVGYVGDGGRIKNIEIENFGAKYDIVGSASVPMSSNTLQGRYEYTEGQLLTAFFDVPHGLKANDLANITLSENTSIRDDYYIKEVPSATKFRVPFKNKRYVNWDLRGGNLTPSGESTWANDYFGAGVALSENGDRLAVLSPGYDGAVTNQGAAFVYERNGNDWVQSNIIVSSDPGEYDFYNGSIAMSGSGNTIIISAPLWESATGNVNVGAVFTYDLTNAAANVWTQRGNILNLTANIPGDNFGVSIALSSKGDVLVVGIPYKDYTGTITGNVGGVYTFDRSANDWIQRGSVLYEPNYGAERFFGWSVALSGDGKTLVAGSYKSELQNTGNLYTYAASGTSWVQIGETLSGSKLPLYTNFGEKIALSKNGAVLVVTSNTQIGTKNYANILSYDYNNELNFWEKRDYELSIVDEDPAGYFTSSPRALKSIALGYGTKILAVGSPTANVNGNTLGGKVTVYDSTFQAASGNITIHPQQANLYPVRGTVCNYKGQWIGKSGFISSNIYLQDNDYYQNNSYVIKTGISSIYWRDLLKKIMNPVGNKFFAEVFLTFGDENLLAIDATPGKPASFVALLLQLIEEVKAYKTIIPYESVKLQITPRSPVNTSSPTHRTLENYKFNYQDLLINDVADLVIENVNTLVDNSYKYQPPMDVYKTGSNLLFNSAFTSTSDWIYGTGWGVLAGNANAVSTTSNLRQSVTLDSNAVYSLSYNIINVAGGSVQTFLTANGYQSNGAIRTAAGKYTDYYFLPNISPATWDPNATATASLVTWLDPSFKNSSYLTVLSYDDTVSTYPYLTSFKGRENTYTATPTTANQGGVYVSGNNFLQRSEELLSNSTNLAFASNVAAVPSISSLYDGISKADRAYPVNGSTGTKYIDFSGDAGGSLSSKGVTTSTPVTFSVYIKSLGTPFEKVGITMRATISGTTYSCGIKFNLLTGLSEGSFAHPPGSVTEQAVDSYTITAVGDGWYRVSITKTYTVGVPGVHDSSLWIIKTSGGVDYTTFTPVAGDLTLGYYVWGRQLEIGSVPGPYTRTNAGHIIFTPPNLKPIISWTPNSASTVGSAYAVSPGIPLSRNMTIFAVFKRNASGSDMPIIGNSSSSNLRFYWAFTNDITVGLNSSVTPITFTASDTRSGYFIASIVMDSSTVSLWLNGSQVGTSQASPADPTGQVFDRLGGGFNGRTVMAGALGEVLVYNKAMSTFERQIVEGYLANNWGQQSLLSTTHPYALQAPAPVVGTAILKGVTSFTGNVDNVTLRKFELVTNT